MRMQFFLTNELFSRLSADAELKNISRSALVTSILEEYYEVSPQFPPFAQLVEKICEEVEEYLLSVEIGKEFPLSKASKTYASIPMTIQNKPNPLRMRVGKAFNMQTRSGRFFERIEQVFVDNKPKRNRDKAALYIKTT